MDSESHSIADSDINHKKLKSWPEVKPSTTPTFTDDKTMDLFPSDNSNQTTNCTFRSSDNESVGSQESIKLRLDSLEDTQDELTSDLKKTDNMDEQSSDASHLPNSQRIKSGLNTEMDSFNRCSHSEGLTPFSKLLAVHRSSSVKEVNRVTCIFILSYHYHIVYRFT